MNFTTTSAMYLDRILYNDDPCDGCGAQTNSGDVVLVDAGGMRHYCFSCVTQTYEAMRAAIREQRGDVAGEV